MMVEFGAATGLVFWGIVAGAFILLLFMGNVLKLPLWVRVIAGLIMGGVLGYFFGERATVIKPIGDAFVQLIRMLVIPLIFTTLGIS